MVAASGPAETGVREQPVNKGLEGVVVAETAISMVDGTAGRLTYRGHPIEELAEHHSFEEVLYLLWEGRLPDAQEHERFARELGAARVPSAGESAFLEALPLTGAPMDALRTFVSGLAPYDACAEDLEPAGVRRIGLRLAGLMATGLAGWLRRRGGQSPLAPDPTLGHAADFLRMLHGEAASGLAARALDTYFILLTEHSLNASTFSARVTISTGSDVYAAITSAIGTLKGVLHGGANQKAMEMLLEIGDVNHVDAYIAESLATKRRLMGLGHRIYKTRDPRAAHLERYSAALAEANGDARWHHLAQRIEAITREHPYFMERKLYPNVEFFTAPLLHSLGLPPDAMPTAFAVSRIGGWLAHIQEQLVDNRIIRPAARYTGPR